MDTTSKQKEDQSRRKKQPQGFASALEKACADAVQKEISYTANGYTKSGMAYHYMERRREYV